MTDKSGKSGDLRRAERLKAALRDNLKRRKAQMKARAQAAKAAASTIPPESPPKLPRTGRKASNPARRLALAGRPERFLGIGWPIGAGSGASWIEFELSAVSV